MLADVKLHTGWGSRPSMTFGMEQNLQWILKAENTNYADSYTVILYSKEIK